MTVVAAVMFREHKRQHQPRHKISSFFFKKKSSYFITQFCMLQRAERARCLGTGQANFMAGFLNIGFLAISGAREQHEPGEQRQQMALLPREIIFEVTDTQGTLKVVRGEISEWAWESLTYLIKLWKEMKWNLNKKKYKIVAQVCLCERRLKPFFSCNRTQ